ncbi:MAG TPA: hypothetical protein PLL78_00895 [Fimbriimonadaceae bacterium]|nr:hypothetical protein [Fimbriimonadaceae bacterium]HRJ95219.1 hypothetical protein [Fimbriimonadaceae bacterium]
MAKTVQDIERALKLKAEPKNQALTLRLGTKKLTLPFEIRLLSSNDYVFVHIPPTAGILKVTDKGLTPVGKMDEAQNAAASFRQKRKRGSRPAAKSVEMPSDLAAVLKKIPAGYKLGYDAKGAPRLVKTRKRGKK